jgi:hypothetical protein
MKKIIVRVVIGAAVLLVVAVAAIWISLGSIVKKGVETVGPQITKVDVKLDSASVSILGGAGSIKGLTVGNPPGYTSPHAISVGTASLSVKPMSVLSDKVIVRSIKVEGPEVIFEGNPLNNNLSKILDNVNASSGSEGQSTPEDAAGKKLQVDDFHIIGAKVRIGANSTPIPIPDIHLTGLGQGPEGITAADLTQRAIKELVMATMKAASTQISELGKTLKEGVATEAGKAGLEKVGKGIGDLFKKKESTN